MLWLAFHLPQLPLEALAALPADTGISAGTADRPPCAVTMQHGARRWIVAADDPALVGTDWASARTRHPELRALERRPRAERDAMQAVAAWAWAYGSELVLDLAEPERTFGVPRALVWVEIGASLKLFGGLDALLADAAPRSAETGCCLRTGVAPTLEAAALLAVAGLDRPILDPSALPAALSPLPLTCLRLDAQIEAALHAVGLSTIGELLALPSASLAKRHGRSLVERLDRLLGRRPDVRPRWLPPNRFQRRFDLLGEVEHTEGLLFPLQRMTRELAQFLNARDTGLQGFRLTLSHGRASGGARQPDTVLVLRLATSTRDPERLLRVLRERLARTPLPSAVRSLKLVADQFIEPATGQRDLFDASAGEDEAWSQLVEKLVARLGAEAVGALGLVADHRPEHGGTVLACETATTAAVQAAPVPLQARPIWLIDPPKPLPTRPSLLEGCERIEGGWWDGGDVMRDYYRAELGGGRFWVYRDRRSDGWYLQGVWA